ncbi:MAG TPA: hypothetical protein VGY76_05630 [Solirubrobacteraceae bacterium]|jgi:hypothetical protein|nr:hypothetical protein [Solirubrobacteraceae bacterium]
MLVRGLRVGLLVGILSMVVAAVLVLAPAALGVGDANRGECPASTESSPGFRPSLPDCRAYELVTPPFTFGQEVAFPQAVSSDGSRFSFSSRGGFGEAGDNEVGEGALYVATREASGWNSISLDASATQFQGEFLWGNGESRDHNASLTEALLTLAPVGKRPIDFRYYRRQSDGSLVEIGPVLSPARVASWTPAEGPAQVLYLGASSDLSHIFFTPTQFGNVIPWFWPGDPTTSKFSLYEYTGIGNSEPRLVDIKRGPEEGKDRPSEHPSIITPCGAGLGGGSVYEQGSFDVYNAISSVPSSEQSRVVFFTAFASTRCQGPLIANELFARVAGARTVAISEPSSEDCEACDIGEAAQKEGPQNVEGLPEGAKFQGASADGSKVFFLSQQKLFGGTRGESGSNLYEYDFNAANPHRKVSLIASAMASAGGVVRVSEDGARVYLVSGAVLVGTGPNEFGAAPQVEADNLYVYDTQTGTATFIAALSPSDKEEWQLIDSRGPVQATGDGRYLLFGSVNKITPDAKGEASQLYRYDAQRTLAEETAGVPRLVRISIGDAKSNNGNNGAFDFTNTQAYTNQANARPTYVSMSSDGSRVFFESSGALTSQALNEVCVYEEEGECLGRALNVYEWEAGHVYLLSDGRDTHSINHTSGSSLVTADASGSNVLIRSDDPLVGQGHGETGQGFTYDVRVDGGFPGSAVPVGCVSECQMPGTASPSLGVPASVTFSGSGNQSFSSPQKKTAARIRAGTLARLLKQCKSKRKRHSRLVCEARARRLYEPLGGHSRSSGRSVRP